MHSDLKSVSPLPHIVVLAFILVCAALLPTGCMSSNASAARYPKIWLQVAPGMTRAQVHTVLGEPQAVQKFPPQEIWRAPGNWKLTVVYDGQDNVTSVVDYRSSKN